MNSLEAVRAHLASRHGIDTPAGAPPEVIEFVVATGRTGRRQRLTAQVVHAKDDTAYLAISTPVAPLSLANPVSCLRLNNRLVGGYLSVDSSDPPYIMMCATLPMETLDGPRLDRVVANLARSADALEDDLTEGRDRF